MSQANIKKYSPVSRNIATKLPEQEYDKIVGYVDDGLFLNTADFVREAIREKLRSMDEIILRDIPLTQQKTEIIEYAKEHKNEIIDAEIIANALKLDVFDVDDIMSELIKEGILEEVK